MITFPILGLVLVLLADAYLASARSVFTRFHLNRQLQTVTLDFRRGQIIRRLLDQYSRVDTSLALAQMISRLAAGAYFLAIIWFGAPAAWTWPVLLSLFGLALLITIVEWAASLLVFQNPASWMARIAGLVNAIYLVFKPLTFLLMTVTRDLEENQKKLNQVSEEDLKTLVDESHKDGLLEEEEQKMIHSVFRLDDTLTREIMVPRIDMEAIDAQVHFSEAVKRFVDSGFSRIPVYQDNVDNIIGLLYAKDLLEICGNGDHQGIVAELVRPAYFVPESMVINELLSEMQKKRVHQAVVVDEYGGVSGIVTLEDIMEEIFGDIQDEYDEEEGLYLTVGPGEYVFQGRINLDELNLILESSLPDDEADTLGGLVYFHLGHVPKIGEVVTIGDLSIKVEQVDEHRISKVRIKKLTSPQEREENDEHDTDA